MVITTGGTGIAPRDSTYEVASRIIERPMDGFGELFRMVRLPGPNTQQDPSSSPLTKVEGSWGT